MSEHRCEGCGEIVSEEDAERGWHTRAEHDPKCDGYRCAPGCPVPVLCGPVTKPKEAP